LGKPNSLIAAVGEIAPAGLPGVGDVPDAASVGVEQGEDRFG
jgi:hypothetical protein